MIDPETIERCRSFIGRTREATESMAPETAAKLAVILEALPPEMLPLCWHWAYFNAAIPQQNVGHDGHEALGMFLPDVPLPRRMWAGGDIDVLAPLVLGVPATRQTTIEDVSFKQGSTGDLCFVTLRHDTSQERLAIRERQTIVYRHPGQPEAALRKSNDPVPVGYRTVPDTTLVAYSAITQNGHRIHWDRDFCRNIENYPDLVVHGPLLATFLAIELEPKPAPCRFRYRAKAPVFETSPFQVVKDGNWARIVRSDGVVAMSAEVLVDGQD